jgi:type II restriction/modification system DNA methylase subunit YeeA
MPLRRHCRCLGSRCSQPAGLAQLSIADRGADGVKESHAGPGKTRSIRRHAMNWPEFKKKWSRYQGKETSAYQSHFDDLCRLLGQPTPNEADPSGTDFFCFQKRVAKDAELFALKEDGSQAGAAGETERGFADVWKKGCFGWEYKGKKKNLDEAYRQLLRYREALLNPPLLVVCDFDRYIIRTNFNGTVQETYEFTNDQIDRPDYLRILRALFSEPEFLKPQRTTAQVTEKVAAQIAAVARSLQSRESVELADAKSRKEVNVAQKKNLRIARFLNRIIFCLFAEATGLLPKKLFTDILKSSLLEPGHFSEAVESLFRVMAKGGLFRKDKIRYFNGHLFEDSTVFELTEAEIKNLADAAEADWQFIQPSIMGTLFERAMDENQRSQLGAHYTSEADIKTLVEPVLMQPFRREWAKIKGELAPVVAALYERRTPAVTDRRYNPKAARERLAAFQKKLAAVTVLDPACGSGNFLYVSLQLLLGLEKEVITFATQLGFAFQPQVTVPQLKAIEINPYAFELAQVSVQIGYLQWRRDNGFDNDRTPVLQVLDGFQNEDALLVPHFHSKAKTLREAQASEHAEDTALKFYTERDWPETDVIVGNPPFLGGKLIRRELGNAYVDALFENLGKRVPPEADLCCYWFEKARDLIEHKKCKRAGLLATQGIRGGANREVLKRIKETGDIFFAESDREWILAGATVHVSMVGFDNGTEKVRRLDGAEIEEIGVQLSSGTDLYLATPLQANEGISFMGITPAGPFDLPFEEIARWLESPNPNGKPNSDVLRPYLNGQDINQRARCNWTIDFGVEFKCEEAAQYELPFQYVEKIVRPIRVKNRREIYARNWWIFAESRPAMRNAFNRKSRFLATCMVAKHRIFAWLDSVCLPANVVIVFGRSDDFFFGMLNSRFNLAWADAQGTQLREKESGSRYTPTTCFETFPFPRPTPKQEAAIAAAAKELNELRERWLNPPEWTETRTLEFPGTVGGPWDRYIDKSTAREVGRVTPCAPSGKNPDAMLGSHRRAEDCPPCLVGTVRYPRLEPRDAECAARLKDRTLTKLYNERPAWLDLAHRKLDAAVAAAYGWPADLTDEAILEKLLALNLERAAEEAKAAKVKKPKTTREKQADELV